MDHKWGISICNTFRPYQPHTEALLFHSYKMEYCESALVRMRIRIQLFRSMWIRYRIQFLFRIQGFDDQILYNFTAEIIPNILIKNWTKNVQAIQKKPPALKREHTALHNMKFLHFFSLFGLFYPPGSGFSSPKSLRIHADPDPYSQHR